MTVKFLRDGVADLNLDLTSMSVASGMTVQSVRRGGPIDMPGPASDNLPFTHSNNRLHMVLPPQSKAGQEFTFTIRYRGTPAAGLRIGPNMHGERTFFGENWPNLVAQLAADDRSPVRQGHRRVHRHRARINTRSSPTAC